MNTIDGVFRVGWATIGDSSEPFMPEPPPGSRYFMTDGWSPDGQHLICMSGEWGDNVDLWRGARPMGGST
jgi:hypothetical protein